ncbi:LytTR family DNA-binding domain-containing protein [Ideonella sp. A 288]|uniref:LytR/AlgR family response regulator transcription factor n=1 Tax=Ideonella sp. A 288 TaxID=1962181 RepID=UPI00130393ED|nr:LytTR family DNA-binding domain-containing protein [Ideonella sp. A 288]
MIALQCFIAEDEPPARQRLQEALARVAPQAAVVGHADTVRGTAAWLATHAPPDLLLLDIQLGDGLSLELFDGAGCPVPVIFTTAYDRFALQAFQALAVDYLLKPVADAALAGALAKVGRLRQAFAPDAARLAAALDGLRPTPTAFRRRLVARGPGQAHVLPVEAVACVVSLDKTSVAVARDGTRHLLDEPLAELEAALDPQQFFRASRQVLVAAIAVQAFEAIGRGRLRVDLQPDPGFEVVISQERAAVFRAWLAR